MSAMLSVIPGVSLKNPRLGPVSRVLPLRRPSVSDKCGAIVSP